MLTSQTHPWKRLLIAQRATKNTEAGAQAEDEVDEGGEQQGAAEEVAGVDLVAEHAAQEFGKRVDDRRNAQDQAPHWVAGEVKFVGDRLGGNRQIITDEVEEET